MKYSVPLTVDMCKNVYLNVVKIANERLEYSKTKRVARTLMTFLLNNLVKKMKFLLRKIIIARIKRR